MFHVLRGFGDGVIIVNPGAAGQMIDAERMCYEQTVHSIIFWEHQIVAYALRENGAQDAGVSG